MVQPALDYYKTKAGKDGEELLTLIDNLKK